MTEAEWLACADPKAMLQHLGAKISDRKARLLSCACCRRVWHFVNDERLQRALANIERFVDNARLGKLRIEAARLTAAFREEHYDDSGKEEEISIAAELWNAAQKQTTRRVQTCGEGAAGAFAWANVGEYEARTRTERAAQTVLVRDIFGNPFRPVAVDPSWLTADVVALARGIYADRAFDRMPILADALQDAGCANDDILNHCRDANHVRGCWVVDLLLGKE